MSRIGAIVRRLYQEELKPAANKAAGTKDERSSRMRRKLTALKNALGKRRTVVWIIRIVVVLVVLFVAAESVFQFNRLVSWHTKVMARWADVEREYQRRENLIPNLVYAVSKYASYEQGVFKYVSDARETLKTIRSSETSGAQVSSLLEKTLSRLVALAEEYPDLKATQSIQDLIAEAANTENRIAEAKKEYNHDCETYNQYQSIFPGNVFAFFYRFKPLPYIGLEEQVDVPVIDLDVTQGRAAIEGDAEVPANYLNKTEGVKE
jgi:LemA protein